MRSVRGRSRIEELCADILEDESGMSGSWCELAAWPESIREAEDVIGECSVKGIPVTFSGGLTGIAGGALPDGGAVVSASMLREIELLDDGNVRAGAGITLEELREFLSRASGSMFYPPDPTEETATVGGTVATDASGSDSYLYGSTRRWVEALRIVVPGGRTLSVRRGEYRFEGMSCVHPDLGTITIPHLDREQPPKNAAGYHMRPDMDLIDLFIGSEGTLGLVAEAELRTAPVPPFLMDIAVFPGTAGAFWELYTALLQTGPELRLRALEMMDDMCIRFLREHPGELPSPPPGAGYALLLRAEAFSDGEMEDAMMLLDGLFSRCGIDPGSAWGGFEPSERRKIREFRHALPESVNHRISRLGREFPGVHKFGSDGAVEPSKLRDYYGTCRGILEERELPYLIFGHAGQGHIHANAIPADPGSLQRAEEAMREIAAAAVVMGGTISAEHGLGRLKLPYLHLMYSAEEIRCMAGIRRKVDPDRILARAMDIP